MKACATAALSASAVLVGPFAFAGCGGPSEPRTPDSEPPTDTPTADDADDPKIAEDPEPADPAAPSGEDDEETGEDDSAGDDDGVAETRTTEVIAKIIKDHRKGARACYEQVLQDVPGLKGDLVIQFILNPDGSMKHAELNEGRSTIKEPKLANCVIEVMRHLDFPESSRGMETKVNYPFNFNP
jgi:hypothetical protein